MQAYLTWLLDRIARLRRDRRLAQYARYRASVKGWQRTRRYNSSVAHQEAGRRWRYTHYADPDRGSYRLDNGFGRRIRWTGLLKVDAGDKGAAVWEANGRRGAARLVLSLGHDPTAIHDEEAWNRAHARVAKSFSNDHVRKFWTKKQAATLGAR